MVTKYPLPLLLDARVHPVVCWGLTGGGRRQADIDLLVRY
jgi:hypothetical protein